MGVCFLCEPPAEVPDDELGRHLLDVHHMDMEKVVDRWPDGQPVIVDQTLEPEDFE